MGFEVDAPVDDVHPVVVVLGAARERECEAAAGAGVKRCAGRGHLQAVLSEKPAREIENGNHGLVAVRDEQATRDVAALLFLVVVVAGDRELDRVDLVAQLDHHGVFRAGVMYQLFEPAAL